MTALYFRAMKESNFDRMMEIIEDTFAMRSDPSQLQVNEKVLEKLAEIHPATLSEFNEGSGPCSWVLVIPTSVEIMNDFLSEKISEQELFDRTKPGMKYEVIYLCSVTTLPEYRGKGITKKLCVEAIEKIRKEFPIKNLFTWAFTKEGDALAEAVSDQNKLPLSKRERKLN
jgi:GNAT superfamily N-acetyltransferase